MVIKSKRLNFTVALSGAGVLLSVASSALAGGYDTGERDWDFLFQQEQVAAEAQVRYINPQRSLTGVVGGFGPSVDVDEASPFAIQRYSIAVRPFDQLRCLASFRQPWGGHADYGTSWTYSASATEQHFSSQDFGLTCAVSHDLGPGQISVLGGGSYQRIQYELSQVRQAALFGGGAGAAETDVSDGGFAWRLGLAFEIPKYALRASLIYNSAVDYDMTGTYTDTNPGFYSGAVYGDITMPQSLEAKVQSGVAPGWLAFGSVKWTDWSVADEMALCPVGVAPCTLGLGGSGVSGLTLLFNDSWTITAGVAHQFNEYVSLVGSLTWDQGATDGFTSQTDTWTAGLSGVAAPTENLEIRLGGTLGLLTSGTLSNATLANGVANPVGYAASFGNDLVWSASAAVALRF